MAGVRDRDRLRAALLAYVGERPDARDSIDGIAAWWLPRGHSWKREEIEEELRSMVKSGELGSWRLTPGTVLYGAPAPEGAAK